MTANVNPYGGNQPQQYPQVNAQPNQPVQPVPPVQGVQNPPQQQPQGQQQDKPKMWYKAVSQKEYDKVKEMGQVTTVLRFLPGFGQNGTYRALFDKDVSRSNYPNTPKWFTPVLVVNDPLHPELNGFVGVMEISKSIHKKLTNTAKVPQNYDDLNNGHNFNLIFEIIQSKDGNQEFPSYNYSKFEQNPSPVDADYVLGRMQALQIADFAQFVQSVNNPQPKQQQGYGQPQQYVNPQTNAAPTNYGPQTGQAPQPQQPVQPPVPQQPPTQQAPQQPQGQQAPQQPPVQSQVPQPQNNQQFTPTQQEDEDSFNAIFGTPDENQL